MEDFRLSWRAAFRIGFATAIAFMVVIWLHAIFWMVVLGAMFRSAFNSM
ncbi:MAG TPA: hypothetical protein VM840_03565 [Actinomycetota bacterium]|nr:hypothetical protein [Actinomycetota bacterium]